MSPFALYFRIYKFCGVWRPTDSSRCFKAFYNIYSALSLFGMCSLTILQFTEIITNTHNTDDITTNSFILLSMVNSCFKAVCVLRHRNEIIGLIAMLVGSIYYKARDPEEIKIQEKFNNILWLNSRRYLILVTTSVLSNSIGSLFSHLKHRTLPYKVWLPYSLSSLKLFWLSYIHQCASLSIAAYINVTTDLFIIGMMIQICEQFEILKHRLISTNCEKTSSKSNGTILEECIRHHNYIIRCAGGVKHEFSAVVIVQLTVSAVVLCSNIYKLSRCTVNTTEFYNLILYMSCILVQLLIYCWYGNEVMLKSLEIGDAAYNMKWTELSVIERKTLAIIIQSTSRPVIFKFAFTISLSLDAYMNILKASYSTYNFLQQFSMD
ncbi:Odorant receptor 43 [Cephus cinctus]|uniref:Odorant receptor n=1 Tax=Cephus cinctus TaxID=211228 RepID=A0A3L9LU48_CEPCN|nr:odorant receptor 67c-like [Cephus cinctus]RLZ02262.1 Odorant receptor 43 [Cephus cinctus]